MHAGMLSVVIKQLQNSLLNDNGNVGNRPAFWEYFIILT
jgi:hypothetical protein